MAKLAETIHGRPVHFLGTKISMGSPSIAPTIRISLGLSAELGKSSLARNDNPSAHGVQGDRKGNVKYRLMVELFAKNIVRVFSYQTYLISIKLFGIHPYGQSRWSPLADQR
jgi:hypothetical protein